MDWKRYLPDCTPLDDLRKIPLFSWNFVFRNLGRLRPLFIALSAASAAGTALRFANVYLVGDVISRFSTLEPDDILYHYAPGWLFLLLAGEAADFTIRRYAEAFPAVYGDLLRSRFALTFLRFPGSALQALSRERMFAIVGRYVGNVQGFLNAWFWHTVPTLTRAVIIAGILWAQSPGLFAINIAVFGLLSALGFQLSKQYAGISERYSAQAVQSEAGIGNLHREIPTLRRLQARSLYEHISFALLGASWDRFDEVRAFHARRWFIQFCIFHLMTVASLVFGIFQVRAGALGLGYLVLIRWAFSELWGVYVDLVEGVVALIQQRTDARAVRQDLGGFDPGAVLKTPFAAPIDWRRISTSELSVCFGSTDDGSTRTIAYPDLSIGRGEKIGIEGLSGVGKSTLLLVLANLVPFRGAYRLDADDLTSHELVGSLVHLVSTNEPLLRLSIRTNLCTESSFDDDRLRWALRGVAFEEAFAMLDLDLSQGGVQLSTGQEQRIRLARAVLSASPVILLDEPFSGLDPATVRTVSSFLQEALRDRTVLVVSHQRAELQWVDRVVTLSV